MTLVSSAVQMPRAEVDPAALYGALEGVVDPELKVALPGHMILLVRNGIYIIENLFLEELARDQCYEFTFICLPLKLQGATGSPVRPIALV